MTKYIDNETSSQNEESSQGEFHKGITEPMIGLLKKYPLALKEANQMLPDILKTSEQAGSYMPIVFFDSIMDIIEYYHCREMVQLSKKAYKLDKMHYRLRKERFEFNKLALSRGEIPDHIFQHVQELQKSEEQEASL